MAKKEKNQSRVTAYDRALYPSMQKSYGRKKKKVEVSNANKLFQI